MLDMQKSSVGTLMIGVTWIRLRDCLNLYCGQGSPLGNPYAHKNMSDVERDIACDRYAYHFHNQSINPYSQISKELRRIQDALGMGIHVNLQCFCHSPTKKKRCHCETIKEYINSNPITPYGEVVL